MFVMSAGFLIGNNELIFWTAISTPLGVNCCYGVTPCLNVLHTSPSVGKVVAQCLFPHFRFLMAVAAHSVGIIRGMVYSVVLLLLELRFFADNSCMLWPYLSVGILLLM